MCLTALAAWACVAGSGCAGSTLANLTGKRNTLEDTQRRYTELVRWGELEMASAFVDPELHDEFLDHLPAFEDIRVTDFESGRLMYEDGDDAASVTVVYHAFSMVTMLETRIREQQEWYREPGMDNTWRVRPKLDKIVDGVAGASR